MFLKETITIALQIFSKNVFNCYENKILKINHTSKSTHKLNFNRVISK